MTTEHPDLDVPTPDDSGSHEVPLVGTSRAASTAAGRYPVQASLPLQWATTGTLTVVVPLEPDADLTSLRKALARIDHDVRERRSPLKDVEGLHVARWVLLPARVRKRGTLVAPSLVMWTVFDGTRAAHLASLVRHGRALLDTIYRAHGADDYPGAQAPDAEVEGFLSRHETRGRVASYVGTPGVSVETIGLQHQLALCVGAHVRQEKEQYREKKENPPSNPHLFLSARNFIREGLRDTNLHEFANTRPTDPPRRNLLLDLASEIGRSRIGVVGFGVTVAMIVVLDAWLQIPLRPTAVATFVALCIAAMFGVLALLVVVWALALLLWVEPREAKRWIAAPMRVFREHHEDLKKADNEGPGMNRMTIVTDVKPGLVRAVTLRFVLWLVAFRARRNFEGRLQGVETIHFAQWRLVDGGRRLLFMSNYDGPALGYFADFSENSAPGVNAIWGNTEGFPPTTAVIGEGSRDLEGFQNAARVHQIATDVWYCGYPNRRFTTARINDNWRIHRLLHEFPTPSEVDEWVALLEGYGA